MLGSVHTISCHSLSACWEPGAQQQARWPRAQLGADRLEAEPASTLKRGSLTLCAYFLICKQGLITVCSSLSCGEDEIS